MNKNIVITGSYNGQDSSGDECLLKCVVQRVRSKLPDSKITIQLHDIETPFIQKYSKDTSVSISRGIQYFMWRVGGLMARLYIPSRLSEFLVKNIALKLAELFGIKSVKYPIRDLRNADVFLVYGGTQFSGQWYKLNGPAYFKSVSIVGKSGGKVVFGPQQYGPFQSTETLNQLKGFLNNDVDEWCSRNHIDVEKLRYDNKGLEVYDEVFSNLTLYPYREPNEPKHILVNIRDLTFDTNDVIDDSAFRKIALLIDNLILYYDIPALFFAVSDGSFCDDVIALEKLKKYMTKPERIESIGRIRDEYQLIELAQDAQVTISMSFHGCLLAGIGGSPFIPITEGKYYNYKYAGFDKYTGMQGVPIIELTDCEPNEDADRIVEFVNQYDYRKMQVARVEASNLLDEFYNKAMA